ncbi:SDR family oxidoreductase [Cellulophaga baltica]|uniref:SDR family oxidoreductase n=1 Tax=Cellulophaga TaxID=104264 RepID=UPI001C06CFA7|nr:MULTISPECIES: SDR family oxidoreductase [Cellulophaga]MBU2995605.1 SDR family oxidoreductase [Cellulophaga baltica]MDO6766999.1 SDR family oxidoreductase [Cellulophaga sp. 1_MG-2023]
MNILLTGATGTLGSRVLFSLIEQRFDTIKHIYLPVRKKATLTPENRIHNILSSEFAPNFIKKNVTEIAAKITVINATNFLNPTSYLNGIKIDFFIHSAGFVNLSTDPNAKHEIFKENLQFTKNIFNAFYEHIIKFVYISTAFAAGNIGGLIQNDYTKITGDNYRNHYEASKHASEKFLIEAGKEKNIPIQILRPSVLGGNITDSPNYFISKYMVFYLFAKFFNNTSSNDKVRITTTANTGLNIIPTDYAAQVIAKVISTDIEQLNIVHSTETNMMKGITKILDAVEYTNFSFTEDLINTSTGFASKLEAFYYETIGVHLHPYMTSKPNEWDTALLESILPIPDYNLEDYLTETVAFAKNKKFRNQKW